MRELKDLVPPPELCKKIPAGEFYDSALMWIEVENLQENKKEWRIVNRTRLFEFCHNLKYPAPTFDEILDELHKCQEDVFVKWSETAYHGWLVNAYTNNKAKVEDYQAHDKNPTTAAMRLWLQLSAKSAKSELSDTIETSERMRKLKKCPFFTECYQAEIGEEPKHCGWICKAPCSNCPAGKNLKAEVDKLRSLLQEIMDECQQERVYATEIREMRFIDEVESKVKIALKARGERGKG